MKVLILSLLATLACSAPAQTLGERKPSAIDFNARIRQEEAKRASLEKRRKPRKRIAHVNFAEPRQSPTPKSVTVRRPAQQTLHQTGAFGVVLRPKAAAIKD